MFNKIKNLLKNKKNKKTKNISIVKSGVEELTNEIKASNLKNAKNNTKVFKFNKKPSEDNLGCDNDTSKSHSNIVDFSEYRAKRTIKKISGNTTDYPDDFVIIDDDDYLDISNSKKIREMLEGEHCFECGERLGTGQMSAVADSGKYRYVCCRNCGCIMKVDDNWNFSNSKNILKEVSDAYKLFRKVNINPKSYSYTRNGERYNF